MSRKLIWAGAGLLAAILMLPLFAGRNVNPAPDTPPGSSINREELVLPRPASDGWERLVTIEGAGSQQSEPFRSQGEQIRIEWSASGQGESQHTFQIGVHDGGQAVATPVQTTVGERTGNVTVNVPSGNYRLHIEAEGVSYRIQVYDRVALNSPD